MNNINICQWAKEDRPRYKMDIKGAECLSNAELLSIIIGTGTPAEDAVSLCARLLSSCNNNLNALAKLSTQELMKFSGIGYSKAMNIRAAMEIGKRRELQTAETRKDMGSASAIYDIMRPIMRDLQTEEAHILLLNQNFRLIKRERISRGGITETAVDVRIIMREAVVNNATILALCHNHPSGSIAPSREDDLITQKIKKACEIMRIYFLDHLIITDGNYFSYHESGRL